MLSISTRLSVLPAGIVVEPCQESEAAMMRAGNRIDRNRPVFLDVFAGIREQGVVQ